MSEYEGIEVGLREENGEPRGGNVTIKYKYYNNKEI